MSLRISMKKGKLWRGIDPSKIVPWKWMGEGSIGIGGEIPVGAELFLVPWQGVQVYLVKAITVGSRAN